MDAKALAHELAPVMLWAEQPGQAHHTAANSNATASNANMNTNVQVGCSCCCDRCYCECQLPFASGI